MHAEENVKRILKAHKRKTHRLLVLDFSQTMRR